jgi:hypothetical protein
MRYPVHARPARHRGFREVRRHVAAHHHALRRRAERLLPAQGGANDWAIALIDFESLAAYEQYRARLAQLIPGDPEAQANVAFVREARAILAERRSFLRKV